MNDVRQRVIHGSTSTPHESRDPDPNAAFADVMLDVEAALAEVTEVALSEDGAQRVRSGQAVILRGRDAPLPGEAWASLRGVPVAIGEVVQGAFQPRRVFNL